MFTHRIDPLITLSEAYISNQETFATDRHPFFPFLTSLRSDSRAVLRYCRFYLSPVGVFISFDHLRFLSNELTKFVNSSCLYLSGVVFFLLQRSSRRRYPFFSRCAPQLLVCSSTRESIRPNLVLPLSRLRRRSVFCSLSFGRFVLLSLFRIVLGRTVLNNHTVPSPPFFSGVHPVLSFLSMSLYVLRLVLYEM